MSEPIFKNAGQAIHFAYLIEHYPLSTRSSLRAAIEQAEQDGPAKARSGIDFGTLSPLEVRAECARIRTLAASLPYAIHSQALAARFSRTPAERETAINHIANHIAPSLKGTIDSALLLRVLLRRHYLQDTDRRGYSLRDLASAHKTSKDRLFRASRAIEEFAKQIERQAIDALRLRFEQDDIVEAEHG